MQHPLKPGQTFKFHDDPRAMVVLSCEMSGGGCAHGPHDTYPDGHHVTAELYHVDDGPPAAPITFYQSGAFMGLRKPEDIVWLGGPPDAAGQWTTVYK